MTLSVKFIYLHLRLYLYVPSLCKWECSQVPNMNDGYFGEFVFSVSYIGFDSPTDNGIVITVLVIGREVQRQPTRSCRRQLEFHKIPQAWLNTRMGLRQTSVPLRKKCWNNEKFFFRHHILTSSIRTTMRPIDCWIYLNFLEFCWIFFEF